MSVHTRLWSSGEISEDQGWIFPIAGKCESVKDRCRFGAFNKFVHRTEIPSKIADRHPSKIVTPCLGPEGVCLADVTNNLTENNSIQIKCQKTSI